MPSSNGGPRQLLETPRTSRQQIQRQRRKQTQRQTQRHKQQQQKAQVCSQPRSRGRQRRRLLTWQLLMWHQLRSSSSQILRNSAKQSDAGAARFP